MVVLYLEKNNNVGMNEIIINIHTERFSIIFFLRINLNAYIITKYRQKHNDESNRIFYLNI